MNKDKRERRERAQKKKRFGSFMIWSAVIIAGGLIGWAILSSGGSNGTSSQNVSEVAESIDENAPVLGDSNAPVTIVEYADFQCPVCNRFFHDAWPQIKEAYIKTGKAKLVYKNFQFIGPDSQRAGEAAQCAGAQGKFWEYHDTLYNHIWDNYYARGINGENRGAFTEQKLKNFAGQLGLNTEQFNSCYDSGTYRKVLSSDRNEGTRQGVRGTPTFFINGQKVVGAQPFSVFAQIIESEL